MLSPIRFAALLRPKVRAAIVASVFGATFAFTATTFLLGPVSEHYGTTLAVTSLISAGQLLGFSVGSFGSRRVLKPSATVFVIACLAAVAANLGSALVPAFAVLVLFRMLTGLAMGVMSWYGWSLVFGQARRTAGMSMIGPLAGVLAGPVIAPVSGLGIGATYVLLAAVAATPLLFIGSLSGAKIGTRPADEARHRPVRDAQIILAALGVFAAGGSALFTFSVLIGSEVGASPSLVAFAYSGNSLAGVLGARWPWSRGPAGLAMAGTGIMAIVLSSQLSTFSFVASIVVWGLLFWIGVPKTFNLLAAKSRYPEERAGDAQAVMAMGRVIGPTTGGVLIDTAGVSALGAVSATIMIAAGAAIWLVSRSETPGVAGPSA